MVTSLSYRLKDSLHRCSEIIATGGWGGLDLRPHREEYFTLGQDAVFSYLSDDITAYTDGRIQLIRANPNLFDGANEDDICLVADQHFSSSLTYINTLAELAPELHPYRLSFVLSGGFRTALPVALPAIVLPAEAPGNTETERRRNLHRLVTVSEYHQYLLELAERLYRQSAQASPEQQADVRYHLTTPRLSLEGIMAACAALDLSWTTIIEDDKRS